MTIIGQPRSFHKKWKFIVEIDGFGPMGFQKFSEPSMEIAKVEHYEGGALIPNKSPGKVTFSDVTLERGATKDRGLWDWVQMVAEAASGLGLPDDTYKRNFAVVQQDRDGSTLRRWAFFGGWPLKYVPGDWDNTSDDVVIESMTLTYDHYKLVG